MLTDSYASQEDGDAGKTPSVSVSRLDKAR